MIGITPCRYKLERNGESFNGFAVVEGANSRSISFVKKIIDAYGEDVSSTFSYSLAPEDGVLVASQTLVLRVALDRESRLTAPFPNVKPVALAIEPVEPEDLTNHMGNLASTAANLIKPLTLRAIQDESIKRGIDFRVECENIMEAGLYELSETAGQRFLEHILKFPEFPKTLSAELR